jgi:hypothetical protein
MEINVERELLINEIKQVEDLGLLKAIKAVLHYGLRSEGGYRWSSTTRNWMKRRKRLAAENLFRTRISRTK